MTITEAEVLQAIQQIAEQELEVSSSIKLTDELIGDLGLDSIKLVTLLATLENRFRVRMSQRESEALKTVEDLMRQVVKSAGGAES